MKLTAALIVILCASCARLPSPPPASIAKTSDTTGIRMADCDGPALSLPPNLRSMLERRTGQRDPDDYWAYLAERIPGGFAGILYDRSGKPTIMLTHPEQAAAAKEALAPDRTFRHFDIVGAQILKARWDFAQLADWYDYILLHTSVWQTKGMTMGDKDEETNRIVLGIETESGRQELVEKLRALDIPCDLIRVVIAGRAYPDAGQRLR